MTNDFLWHLFEDTGDPLTYLMYKAANAEKAPPRKDSDTDLGAANMPAAEG